MHEIREALGQHARLLEAIIKRQDEQEEALMLLGDVVLEDEYYTVEGYAEMSDQPLRRNEARMLNSVAFHLSKMNKVPVDGLNYRVDILKEAFRWTF